MVNLDVERSLVVLDDAARHDAVTAETAYQRAREPGRRPPTGPSAGATRPGTAHRRRCHDPPRPRRSPRPDLSRPSARPLHRDRALYRRHGRRPRRRRGTPPGGGPLRSCERTQPAPRAPCSEPRETRRRPSLSYGPPSMSFTPLGVRCGARRARLTRDSGRPQRDRRARHHLVIRRSHPTRAENPSAPRPKQNHRGIAQSSSSANIPHSGITVSTPKPHRNSRYVPRRYSSGWSTIMSDLGPTNPTRPCPGLPHRAQPQRRPNPTQGFGDGWRTREVVGSRWPLRWYVR
jgi:hypothetical protein